MVTIMGGGEEPWSRCGPWTVTRHDIVMADGHYTVARTTRHRPVSDDTHGRIRHGYDAPHHVDIHSINICHMCWAYQGQIIQQIDPA